MATKASIFTKHATTAVTGGCAGDVITNDYFHDVEDDDIVLNGVIDIGVLPANHGVVDMFLIPDKLDTGTATIALDVGLMSGEPGDETSLRTCGNEFFAADIAARTGVVSRMTKKEGFLVKPSGKDRSIGVKFQAAADAPADGRIRLRVLMAPANPEVQF